MLTTTMKYLPESAGLERVVLCLYGKDAYKVFEDEVKRLVG